MVYLRPIQGLELVHVVDGGVKIEIEDEVAPAERGYPVVGYGRVVAAVSAGPRGWRAVNAHGRS